MSAALAMPAPASPQEMLEILRQWGGPTAVAAVAGWLVAQWRTARARSAKEREEQRLQGKAIRELLDSERMALHALVVMTGADNGVSGLLDLEQLIRHRELVSAMTDEFWIHDGHASERELRRTGDIKQWATRTQAIRLHKAKRAAEGPQDMFKPEDITE